jgi:hypothetical protein
MGKLKNGPRGHIIGKVGGLVGTNLRGENIVKTAPKKRTSSSPKQLAQQSKFKIANDFYTSIKKLVNVTFASEGNGPGSSNATGHLLNNAISGTAPNIFIDYSKVSISRGHLPPPEESVVTTDGNSITFTWIDNSAFGSASETDEAMLVVYCPSIEGAISEINAGTRKGGSATIDASLFEGEEVHTWLGFIKANKKKVSDSRYTGKLMLVWLNQA